MNKKIIPNLPVQTVWETSMLVPDPAKPCSAPGGMGERQHPLPCLVWGERKGLKGRKHPKAQEQGAARAPGTSTRTLLEATRAGSCCD